MRSRGFPSRKKDIKETSNNNQIQSCFESNLAEHQYLTSILNSEFKVRLIAINEQHFLLKFQIVCFSNFNKSFDDNCKV